MALLPALAVDGARVPGSMLRMFAWVATSGAAGVVTPEDFKVSALPTPGGAVSINAGGAVIPTRFGNATKQQSYIVANDQAFNLTVPAAGAAGRTDYVIVTISDPEYTGQVPTDPLDALYCEVVRVSSLPAGVPYLALARINMPANTATITDAMITDMREVAVPRRQRDTLERVVTSPQNLTGTTYVDFPSQSSIQVSIPEWASKAIIRCDLLETITQTNNVDGEMVLMLGNQPAYTNARRFDEVWAGSTARQDHTIVASFTIPQAMRGTSQPLRIRARKIGGSGLLRADTYTQVIYDVEFLEIASL